MYHSEMITYLTGGNYPCLMIQTNRSSQIQGSSLNSHMDSLGSLNSHPMGNLNGGSSLLRITLQHSMLHLLTAPSQQPRVICHHSSSNGHDVVSGLF